jgi:hypothetical protein
MSPGTTDTFRVAIVGMSPNGLARIYYPANTCRRRRNQWLGTGNGTAQERHLFHAVRRSKRVLGRGVSLSVVTAE